MCVGATWVPFTALKALFEISNSILFRPNDDLTPPGILSSAEGGQIGRAPAEVLHECIWL
jgi:hypothetical protein